LSVAQRRGAANCFCGDRKKRKSFLKFELRFPRRRLVLDRLSIRQLASLQARLAVFVSNDTGPLHIAAAVGAPVVLLLDERAPASYIPLSEPKRVIQRGAISQIAVEEVYEATRALLTSGRVEQLFAT
jgi:ADP-heptose:LPS heptosyltransferase